jgi:hypothetical protein
VNGYEKTARAVALRSGTSINPVLAGVAAAADPAQDNGIYRSRGPLSDRHATPPQLDHA